MSLSYLTIRPENRLSLTRRAELVSRNHYVPIDCNAFDYVELACLYRYPVRLYLRDGGTLEGVAADTKTSSVDGEHLVLDLDGELRTVRLDTIAELEPLRLNARFGRVPITGAA